MKQIYHFDSVQPPALSEKTLNAELERRKIRRYTTILASAGVLVNVCLVVMAVVFYPINIYLSIACICYTFIAICGGGVIAAIYTNSTRRNNQCLSQ